MDREFKFRFLDAVGFTREDAEAYFNREKTTNAKVAFKLDFPLAYLIKGQLIIRHELDFSHMSEIWGVVIGKTVFSVLTYPETTYDEARKLVGSLKVEGKKVSLPSTIELHRDSVPEKFNHIISLLNNFGVKAEPWIPKHYYWSNDAYFNGTVCSYNVFKNELDIVHGDKKKNMSTRLVILL